MIEMHNLIIHRKQKIEAEIRNCIVQTVPKTINNVDVSIYILPKVVDN
jgi:hypothetical protein